MTPEHRASIDALQSSRYAQGQPNGLPAWCRPQPFVWESPCVLMSAVAAVQGPPELAKMSPIDK